jgi:hypothetical protein
MTGERPVSLPGRVIDVPVAPNGHKRPSHWQPIGPILPERMRRQRRPRLWQEIAFILVSYWVYSLIRNAVPTHEKPALEHARSVLHAEKLIHIDFEHSLNRVVDAVQWGGWHWLADVSNYYYAVMHFIVVVAVLVWVYVEHPMNYRSTRTALYATNGLAAIGFWFYPLAPPRLMQSQSYIDTVVKYHTWGSWGSGGISKVSNQFAAMPSLHIGWSLWAGITLFMLTRRWWIRVLAVAYPLVTFFVIVGTANHFVLDAAGGVVVLALGFGIQRVLTGRPAYGPTPAYPDRPKTGPQPVGPAAAARPDGGHDGRHVDEAQPPTGRRPDTDRQA